ncbi:putative palmitoyl-protein thioesterase 1 [Rosellinia necatrix]|uniref:Palmitoyl-protein thioesterase 1 n=1 Tax=Rosellinia necatrix TaxID=77044 RepID=A0A1W2TUS7_ROSNE|nr:putative palmitoyl-protein thioesterase 1 [Rosellinia necatrix]
MYSLQALPFLATLTQLLSAATAAATAAEPALSRTPADDNDDTPLPVVVWHGLGDAYSAEGMQQVGQLIEAAHPGTFVYFVRLDASASNDRRATFYGNVTEQLAQVCADLAAHPILSTAPAVDAVGFSQGGQFLRGYVERCSAPPVRSLLTFGSQHNGIVDYRTCDSRDWLCRGAMALLHGNTWTSFVQSRLVPAQYFRDPADLDSYLAHSNFLADINNERPLKNATYAANLAALENLVLYVFEDDATVVPKETGWFEEVEADRSTPLRERKLYQEDWIGLRALDQRGGLTFKSIPGEHMQISEETLTKAFSQYFGPYKVSSREAPVVNEL